MKGLIEAAEIVELLAERIAEEHLRAVPGIGAREQRLKLIEVVRLRGLHAQLRAQQPGRILRGIERDAAVAGGFGTRQVAEAALGAGEVVPEARLARGELGGPPIECVGALVAAERHRDEGQSIVGVRYPWSELQGRGDHLLGVRIASELEEHRRE